ncbi:MAG TPA: branched-chain amino acid ABC transporter permease, partial [Gammaproteobacteria bacterium]|nr:branched-chain amino acid ABC transporter permease [Gammaproteobacteria bacterium]
QLINQVFGSDLRTASPDLGTLLFMNGIVSVGVVKLAAFVLALLVGVLLWLFIKFSRLGQAIRATAQNPRAARILGVETDHVFAFTFALNAALCGAAGSLAVMAYTIHPYIGLPYTVRSFMIVVTAGVGNLPGVVVAGLGLGVAENFAGFLLGAQFQVAFVFLLMVLVLVVRSRLLRHQRKYLE